VTPLLLGAVWDGQTERAKLMISQGADVNATNFFGQPPLIIAADHCYTEIAKLLIEAGANVNFTYPETSQNVLAAASQSGCSAIIRLLKETGAKPLKVKDTP
jgi:ankyrin repeat protein